MKNTSLISIVCLFLIFSCEKQESKGLITIDLAQKGADVSPSMYGVFFEEINHAGDGGLYAEMVQNRSFESKEYPEGYRVEGDQLFSNDVPNHLTGDINKAGYKWTTEEFPGWSLKAEGGAKAVMKLTKNNPLFESTPNSLQVDISKPGIATLVNSGYWGMGVKKDEQYNLRFYVRDSKYTGKLNIQLVSSSGEVLENKVVELKNTAKWHEYKLALTSNKTDKKANLAFKFEGKGTVWLDYVSLFPQKTFKNRPNGLREDVVKALTDLNPGFVRWPGGCVVEGISLDNRYEWKETLGDPAARKGEYGLWGYRNTYGFGYHEFLQFCEDTNSEGMYVCNVGIGCQARSGDACSIHNVQFYVDDVLDAIEYAIGDESTKWGAKRAEAGHSKPFPLKYVEIGNENYGELYNERFDIFYKAIKEKYPQLILISNHGLGSDVKNVAKTDMIDPHWYVAPNFFFKNADIFDDQPREGYKVYVGEYACNQGVGSGNMLAALSEAAFITGMERNSDLVTMASYAPLFENKNDRTWPVNLIWIDNMQVVGRSSYYVQKMTTENMPTYNLGTKISAKPVETRPLNIDGNVGVGSWSTQVDYKDFEVIYEDGKTEVLDIRSNTIQSGEWTVSDTVVSQNTMSNMTGLFLEKKLEGDYTVKLKAKKVRGNEGFLIYFGMTNNNKDGHLLNIGGWNNTQTALEGLADGNVSEMLTKFVPQKVENNKWYAIEITKKANALKIMVDGKELLSYTPTDIKKQFVVSGYDETTQEVIVKVVNADDTSWSPSIDLLNGHEIKATGKAIVLSANSPEEENSFEEPLKISPEEVVYTGYSSNFTYNFLPYSYTVLRIKVEKN
ncbi:alpha-L-arabinofuranosidase C-terminal domain-containing protein [Maribacter sp.]|uniref:alpha-L-arabinofuranosidase C-terminal domain-containing protein n=1 Tax=Maribacter sp. TaxID=1897614 RepID=UPI0025BCF583|nr:alpha-L-arabinofuranosidase C-terminal domain-containing protein [Maribacter sp.]